MWKLIVAIKDKIADIFKIERDGAWDFTVGLIALALAPVSWFISRSEIVTVILLIIGCGITGRYPLYIKDEVFNKFFKCGRRKRNNRDPATIEVGRIEG
ncbi:hypothetical protein [Ensifer sp. CCNWLW204]